MRSEQPRDDPESGEVVQPQPESNHDWPTDQMEKVLKSDLSHKSSVNNVWIGQADSGCYIAIVTVNPLDSILERELSHIKAVLDGWGKVAYSTEREAMDQPIESPGSFFNWFKSQISLEPRRTKKQIKFVVELSDPLADIQREVEQINTLGTESE